MGAIVELRKDLLNWRISRNKFAKLSGLTASEFDAALRVGGETTVAMDKAWRRLRRERSVDGSVGEVAVEASLEGASELVEGGNRRCFAGRPVRNRTLLLVAFDDGGVGRVRKKPEFSPRQGMELEVEPSEEDGFWNLVGKYRDNGVRLG